MSECSGSPKDIWDICSEYGRYSTVHSMRANCTHVSMVSAILGSMAMGFPQSSSGGVMLKVWRTIAMFVNNDASAKCLPGHILRRPGASADAFCELVMTASRPSSVSKCEAGGVADIGVQLAVAQEAFWKKTLGFWIGLGIVQAGPV